MDSGVRCVCGEDKGTIRYRGPVVGRPATEVWLGVEWDSSTRGKHDGVHEGKRYFQCSPGCGSFVPEGKVQVGRTLRSALEERYVVSDTTRPEEMYVETSTKQPVRVEHVGQDEIAERQRHLDWLPTASVTRVAAAGPAEELVGLLPRLEMLDLCDNLLTDWETVAAMTRHLPRLTTLQLGKNRLDRPDETALSSYMSGAFTSVRVLVLSATGTNWHDWMRLCPFFPVLEEIHLCQNHIECLCAVEEGMDCVRLVNLDRNVLSSWNEVTVLAGLKRLACLMLNDNLLTEIHSEPALSRLTSLMIARNRLSTWASIDDLDRFPALMDVRLQGNPLLAQAGPVMGRRQIIARMERVTLVDGSEVRAKERWEAERAYVKMVAVEIDEEGLSEDVLRTRHPRYRRLVEIHGDPTPTASGTATQTLSSQVVAVTLSSRAKSSVGRPDVVKRIPVSMTVLQLKTMLWQLFGLNQAKQRLFHMTFPVPDCMDDELKPISFYGVGEGSFLVMEEFDPSVHRAVGEAEKQRADRVYKQLYGADERDRWQREERRREKEAVLSKAPEDSR